MTHYKIVVDHLRMFLKEDKVTWSKLFQKREKLWDSYMRESGILCHFTHRTY